MSGYTVHVYNTEGRRVLSFDNVTVDNDLEPPYAVLRNEAGEAVALVSNTFMLEIVRAPAVPSFVNPCKVTAGCWLPPGHEGRCD